MSTYPDGTYGCIIAEFVGGPHDGKRVLVSDQTTDLRIPLSPPFNPIDRGWYAPLHIPPMAWHYVRRCVGSLFRMNMEMAMRRDLQQSFAAHCPSQETTPFDYRGEI